MNKIQKRWVLILSVVLAVILILTFTANSIISSKADSFLRNKLAATDTSSYIIDFGSLRVNIFTRSVKVFDISIKQTEAAFENLRTNKHAPIGFEANIERIKIGRVGIFDALEGKSLDIGSVVVSEPLITVYSPEGMFPEKHKQKREETESQPDSSSKLPMDEAFIGNIRIIDGMVRWIDMRNEERVMDVSLLNVEMDDVHVHHPGDDSLSFILDTEELNIMLNSMSMVLPGKLYTLKTDRLDISYKDKQVSLDSLRLIPAYSKSRFGQIVGKQTDRFDLKIANILLSGIEFDSIFNKKAIISKVTLTGPSADIYRDKGIPRDMNHFPKLYQTAIAQLPILLDISVVEIIDGMVDYQEKVEWSTMAGGVTFEDFDITISGISNDKEKINNGLAMRVDATAILMGKADLELHLTLPIGRHDEYFTFEGKTGAFPAGSLNPLIAPLAALEATGGTINKCSFYGLAKQDTAVARVEFLYTDMEMIVLKKEKESQGILAENKFLSMVAQTAMHKNNPSDGKDIRVGMASFARDPNKGFFNYIWKTIQTGLISTIAPLKKNHAQDMDWPTFSANWENVLLNDRMQLNAKSEKSKERRRK